MDGKYHVKGTRSNRTPPKAAVGRDLEGFYTYPKRGHYATEAEALQVCQALQAMHPRAMFFVQFTPAAFDGVSVPGL